MAYTYTPVRMIPGSALTGSLATYYTVGAAPLRSGILKELVLCNTDTVPRTVTVNIIPPAGSAAVANTIINAMTVQPNETRVLPFSAVMPTGYFIQALASAAAVVSIAASGVEVSA